ncbi:hypothetical protein FB107DRAFT_271488 [Schizophyllum commune]
MSSRDSKPSPLVAFPSVSSSLSSLHQATSMQGVALHHNMYANRAKESEAKLKKALSNASQNIPAGSPYTTPTSSTGSDSSTVMMRKPVRTSPVPILPPALPRIQALTSTPPEQKMNAFSHRRGPS